MILLDGTLVGPGSAPISQPLPWSPTPLPPPKLGTRKTYDEAVPIMSQSQSVYSRAPVQWWNEWPSHPHTWWAPPRDAWRRFYCHHGQAWYWCVLLWWSAWVHWWRSWDSCMGRSWSGTSHQWRMKQSTHTPHHFDSPDHKSTLWRWFMLLPWWAVDSSTSHACLVGLG